MEMFAYGAIFGAEHMFNCLFLAAMLIIVIQKLYGDKDE